MAAVDVLRKRLGEGTFTTAQFRDNRRIVAPADRVFEFLRCLKEECGFDLLFEH